MYYSGIFVEGLKKPAKISLRITGVLDESLAEHF
jgi:hypothetical protein